MPGSYLVPLTIGFLVAAPLSGILSDKFGPKALTVGGFFSPNDDLGPVRLARRDGGMIATFQISAFVLSIGIFTLMVAGLSSKLPRPCSAG